VNRSLNKAVQGEGKYEVISKPFLHGGTQSGDLALARLVWIAIALLALSLYAVNISIEWANLGRLCPTAACAPAHLSPATTLQLSKASIPPRFFISYFTVTDIFSVLVYLGVAVFIFLRRSSDGMAILVSLMLVTFGVVTASGSFDDAASTYPALVVLSDVLNITSNICLMLFFYLFPNGRFVPRWTSGLAVLSLPIIVLVSLFPDLPVNNLIFLFAVVSFLYIQIYHYKYVSDIEQRQQTKWVLFGTAIAMIGLLLLSLLIDPINHNKTQTNPPALYLALLSNSAFHLIALLIPVSLAIAILRYRLFDIDMIVRRTLTYATLTACLALVYFGSVLLLQQVVRLAIGTSSPIAVVLSTLVIAALFAPLQRRLQDIIDRRFFRRKYNVERAIETFRLTTRNEVELGKLTEKLIATSSEALQPMYISLWLKQSGDSESSDKFYLNKQG
jgi:hypothetical protein